MWEHDFLLYRQYDPHWTEFCETWKSIGKYMAVAKLILAADAIIPPFSDDPDRVKVRKIMSDAGMILDADRELAEAVAGYYREEIGLYALLYG